MMKRAFDRFFSHRKTIGIKDADRLVREAGLEPARPEWTLEPESSESANSTTRATISLSKTASI